VDLDDDSLPDTPADVPAKADPMMKRAIITIEKPLK